MTKKGFWYSDLEQRAAEEAEIIVDAFGERGIDIGGETDWAEDDRDLHPGGIAFMYDRDHILTREQYLGGVGGMRGPQSPVDASKQQGVLDVLQNRVPEVEVIRVAGDVVLICLNPRRHKGLAVRRARHALWSAQPRAGTWPARPEDPSRADLPRPRALPQA